MFYAYPTNARDNCDSKLENLWLKFFHYYLPYAPRLGQALLDGALHACHGGVLAVSRGKADLFPCKQQGVLSGWGLT